MSRDARHLLGLILAGSLLAVVASVGFRLSLAFFAAIVPTFN